MHCSTHTKQWLCLLAIGGVFLTSLPLCRDVLIETQHRIVTSGLILLFLLVWQVRFEFVVVSVPTAEQLSSSVSTLTTLAAKICVLGLQTGSC